MPTIEQLQYIFYSIAILSTATTLIAYLAIYLSNRTDMHREKKELYKNRTYPKKEIYRKKRYVQKKKK